MHSAVFPSQDLGQNIVHILAAANMDGEDVKIWKLQILRSLHDLDINKFDVVRLRILS